MRGRVGAVTIYDVAGRAGVSISTVSLVMNAPQRVSPATREKVVEAAAELGYRLSHTPRGSAAGGLRIAVAAPFRSYPSYYRRLDGLMVAAGERAIDIVPYNLESAASAPTPFLDALPARRDMDGVIVMGVPLGGAAMRSSRSAGLPVVLVDVRGNRPSDRGLPAVLVDDVLGGQLLATHLRERGHERAFFVHEPQLSRSYVSAGMLRAEGLSGALDLVDVTVDIDGDPGEVIQAALRKHPEVRAAVANHDVLAARLGRALFRAGRRVPEDLALAGYDDGDIAAALDLTTVRQPFEESGAAALDLLLQEISGRASRISRVVLAPTLIVRGSTGAD